MYTALTLYSALALAFTAAHVAAALAEATANEALRSVTLFKRSLLAPAWPVLAVWYLFRFTKWLRANAAEERAALKAHQEFLAQQQRFYPGIAAQKRKG